MSDPNNCLFWTLFGFVWGVPFGLGLLIALNIAIRKLFEHKIKISVVIEK